MSDAGEPPEEKREKPGRGRAQMVFTNLERINAFSDAVFAVAITLLVLSIRVPHITGPHTNANLFHELGKSGDHLRAFVLSFVIIGAFWISHHSLFNVLRKINGVFLWLNLLCLMLIVFIPYPTVILSEYGGIQLAMILYAVTMAATGLMMALLCWYAARGNRLVDEDFDHEFTYGFVMAQLNISVVFLISIAISFANVDVAMYFWLMIIVSGFFLARYGPLKEAFKRSASPGKG